MKIKNGFHGINRRLCLVFIVITCTIVVTVSTILIFVFNDVMSRRMIENQKIFLRQNQTNVQGLVNGFNQVSVNLTTDQQFADLLNQESFSELALYNGGVALKRRFTRYTNAPLSSVLTTYFSRLYVFDDYPVAKALESKSLQYDAQSLSGVYSAADILDDAWAQTVLRKNGALHTFVLPEDPQTVFIARLVRNIDLKPDRHEQGVGIMLVGLSMQQFKNQVEALALTEHAEVYILDESDADARVLYASASAQAGGYARDNEKLRTVSTQASGATVRIGGARYLYMKYTTYWDWGIISLIPMADIQDEINSMLGLAILVSVVGIVIGSVLIAITSYTVTKPIVDLSDAMGKIQSSGDIIEYPSAVLKHHDEVTLLYETFRKLLKRIEQLIADGYENGIKTKELELIALQAQINPHFIYNALDSINWIAMCDGNDDIVEIVSSLANIMRYSIKNPNERVHLADELIHVENYIKIQSKQSGSNIDVLFEIDKQFLSLKMPKFLIEPLVENCVVHALRGAATNGKVLISCKHEDDLLFIEVSDNGCGADVVLLNQYLVGEIPMLAHSDGFGIKNIDERVKLNYGNAYGLCFFKNRTGGLTAQIILPYAELISTDAEKSKGDKIKMENEI